MIDLAARSKREFMEGSPADSAASFAREAANARIEGLCRDGFEPVANAFVENFLVRGDIGAAACHCHRGEVVVDLWGGLGLNGVKKSLGR